MAATARRTVLLSLACLTAACAATGPSGGPPEAKVTEQLFTDVYRNIRDVYFVRRDTSELALAGLSNLALVDDRIAVVKNGNAIALSIAGEAVGSFDAPISEDSGGWGELTAEVIDLVGARSGMLEEAGFAGIHDVVLTGIFDQLDEQSIYFRVDPEADTSAREETPSVGIGVSLGTHPDGVRVFFVGDDAPARKAGLRRGDIIALADGWPLKDLAPEEVWQSLSGPPGSRVRLTIKRQGLPAPLTVTVVRQESDQSPINHSRLGDVAYFQVDRFNEGTADALSEKMSEVGLDQDDGLRGVVVDLRSNLGGRLREGVGVADLFLDFGLIAETHGRHWDSHQKFSADPWQRLQGRPLVLLINGSTSGAAEIVAAALQDHGRAVLIGSASNGSGAIQTVLSLPNKAKIKLTWAMLRAPNGYPLYGRGVLPDICTTDGPTAIEQVLDRLRAGRLPLAAAVRQRPVDPRSDEQIEALRAHCPPRDGEDDIDLAVARRLLQDPELFERALGNRQP